MTEWESSTPHAAWNQSIYDELHRLAERALSRETPGHSLQPTLLVNDAYMKLLQQKNVEPAERSRVFATGANIIRRLLVDYARKRKAQKRGGPAGRGVPLEIVAVESGSAPELIELDDALNSLSRENPRLARVVELKFFGGLTGEEIADELQVSLRTVNNDWRFAKAWLYRTLGDPETKEEGLR